MQENKGTRWHVAQRVIHAGNTVVWSPLTQVTEAFLLPLIHHPSIMNTSAKDEDCCGKKWINELNRRCTGEAGTCWTSGCSPQLSGRLHPDLEEIRKLRDPPSVGSEKGKKKKPPSLCVMNYWVIGPQLLKYTGGWSVSPCRFHILGYLVLLF